MILATVEWTGMDSSYKGSYLNRKLRIDGCEKPAQYQSHTIMSVGCLTQSDNLSWQSECEIFRRPHGRMGRSQKQQEDSEQEPQSSWCSEEQKPRQMRWVSVHASCLRLWVHLVPLSPPGSGHTGLLSASSTCQAASYDSQKNMFHPSWKHLSSSLCLVHFSFACFLAGLSSYL